MNRKMSYKVNTKLILYFILVLALLNGPLRLTENGATSLYRLSAPLIIFAIILRKIKYYKKDLLIIGGIVGYSVVVSLVFYNHISFDQTAVALYVFFIYLLMKEIKRKNESFYSDFFGFLNVVTHVSIVAAWLQYFFHYTVPYMEVSRGQPVGVYLSNGNELSEAFMCMFIIYIYLILLHHQYRYIPACISILFISYINDAKLSMMGGLVATGILFLYMRHVKKKKKLVDDNIYFIVIFSIIVAAIIAVYVINPELKFRDYKIGVRELFFDSVTAIFTGKELAVGGSIHDRTMAIIYGIRELKNSWFFGIGIGNSIVMLQKPEYILRTAKSMHNILFQFLTELGYVAIFVYILIVKRIVSYFKNVNKYNVYLLKAIFAIGFIFISSQSSVGILANYYTIIVFLYIAFIDIDGEDFYKKHSGVLSVNAKKTTT